MGKYKVGEYRNMVNKINRDIGDVCVKSSRYYTMHILHKSFTTYTIYTIYKGGQWTYIISLAEVKNSMPYHRIPHYVLNTECQLREWELSILNFIHTSVYIIQFLLCLKTDFEKDGF